MHSTRHITPVSADLQLRLWYLAAWSTETEISASATLQVLVAREGL